jgi:hypothetical protein
MDEVEESAKRRFELIEPHLSERTRRLFAAAEARIIGHGGISAISRATGVSRRAIQNGLKELDENSGGEDTGNSVKGERVRRAGGGRHKLTQTDPQVLELLEGLVEPTVRGDPESPLRWTCKSLRVLAKELALLGVAVSHTSIAGLLESLGYSLQANSKTREGASHPDRNAQFEFVNRRCAEELALGNPVISVDTKKKELVGDFKNGGREYRPKGDPEQVRVHDFADKILGKANPYGIYDLQNNCGWVNVGTDRDTSAFAVESIRRWWRGMGEQLFPQAEAIQIFADGGGSNGSRVRLWKVELQGLAEELGMPIRVSHLPPGTSKWNKIEHKLFSFITMNWRGRPLISHEVIVNLIKATRNNSGLYVEAGIDDNTYPTGIKITDKEMEALNIVRDEFHGEWNYELRPRQKKA